MSFCWCYVGISLALSAQQVTSCLSPAGHFLLRDQDTWMGDVTSSQHGHGSQRRREAASSFSWLQWIILSECSCYCASTGEKGGWNGTQRAIFGFLPSLVLEIFCLNFFQSNIYCHSQHKYLKIYEENSNPVVPLLSSLPSPWDAQY